MNATLETHDSLPRNGARPSDIRDDRSTRPYSMSNLLQLVVSEGSSDLHIRVGVPPVIRVHGVLQRVEGPPLRPKDTEELMRSIASEDHIRQVREKGGADFGFAFGDMARFRVSAFKEKGNVGLVLRQIPT